VELSSFAFLFAYRRLHSDPLAPQKSAAYDKEEWGREFWTEQTSFWSKARSNYLPFTVWAAKRWHGKYTHTDDTQTGTWRRTIQTIILEQRMDEGGDRRTLCQNYEHTKEEKGD
jgi:hypothetical protein